MVLFSEELLALPQGPANTPLMYRMQGGFVVMHTLPVRRLAAVVCAVSGRVYALRPLSSCSWAQLEPGTLSPPRTVHPGPPCLLKLPASV